jgi:Prealbumin-like fold domain
VTRVGWRGVLLGLLLLLAVGCSEIGIPVDTPTPPSGIRGTVVLGPTCPVEQEPGANEPIPCLTPYSANLAIIDSEGVRVESVTSGADGRFQVNLPPGDYVVTPASGPDTYPIAQPVSVTVPQGVYADVEINYDTGIR